MHVWENSNLKMFAFENRAGFEIIQMQRKFTVKNCSYFGNSFEVEITWCGKFKFENICAIKLFGLRYVRIGKKITIIS